MGRAKQRHYAGASSSLRGHAVAAVNALSAAEFLSGIEDAQAAITEAAAGVTTTLEHEQAIRPLLEAISWQAQSAGSEPFESSLSYTLEQLLESAITRLQILDASRYQRACTILADLCLELSGQ